MVLIGSQGRSWKSLGFSLSLSGREVTRGVFTCLWFVLMVLLLLMLGRDSLLAKLVPLLLIEPGVTLLANHLRVLLVLKIHLAVSSS